MICYITKAEFTVLLHKPNDIRTVFTVRCPSTESDIAMQLRSVHPSVTLKYRDHMGCVSSKVITSKVLIQPVFTLEPKEWQCGPKGNIPKFLME